MARDTRGKFEDQMDALAAALGIEAVIDKAFSNIGTVCFQSEDDFDPILSFRFDHQHGYSTFEGEQLEPRRWYCEHVPKGSGKRTIQEFVEHVTALVEARVAR